MTEPFSIHRLHWIHPADERTAFPPVENAFREPNGLLAFGGNLSTGRLLMAYREGIFPWYSDDQPIMWWSPDPRAVLFPERLRISRSLRKRLRQGDLRVTLDTAFERVIRACAEPRPGQSGTWITEDMIDAYCRLHALGLAHSAEAWAGAELVGGLYGLAVGRLFCGESMSSRRVDASKVAYVHLVRQLQAWGFAAIDCQVPSPHLESLGAARVPRAEFLALVHRWRDEPTPPAPWRLEETVDP